MNLTGQFGEIIPCPNCEKNVRVPVDVELPATVLCPVCDCEFDLGDWLDEWIPELKVVSSGNDVVDAELLAIDQINEDREFEPLNKVSDVRVKKPKFASETSLVSKSNRKRKRGRKSRRTPIGKRKNKKHEMAKMIVGGLLAIPIAQMIIWWALGKDPAKLAPRVESFAPFMIPASLRTEKPKEIEPEADDGLEDSTGLGEQSTLGPPNAILTEKILEANQENLEKRKTKEDSKDDSNDLGLNSNDGKG